MSRRGEVMTKPGSTGARIPWTIKGQRLTYLQIQFFLVAKFDLFKPTNLSSRSNWLTPRLSSEFKLLIHEKNKLDVK